MRTWDEPKKRKAHIELIPMIDVMMFLLVFFVLVSLNVIPALGMKTQLPSASSSQQLGVTTAPRHDGQVPDENAGLTAATMQQAPAGYIAWDTVACGGHSVALCKYHFALQDMTLLVG